MSAERTDRDSSLDAPPVTSTAGLDASVAGRAPATGRDGPAVLAIRDLCPFLLAADGGWRGAEPTRDHRCTAVFPPAQLAAEKQGRLCLTSNHESCATFIAASDESARDTAKLRAGTRPMPRTTPVVLERRRFSIPALSLRSDRTIGQAALVILLAIAFTGILVARLSPGAGGSPAAIALPSASPGATAPASTASARAATPSPSPADADPSPQITLVPTEVTPPPSSTPTTYTVKRGDTLSGIAAVYGTTWQVLAELNDIKNPSALRTGTVLQLP